MNEIINPTVYGQASCQFCTAAVKLLEANGYTVNYLTVGKDISKEEYFAKFPGVRTVPMIEFMNESFSYPELKAKMST